MSCIDYVVLIRYSDIKKNVGPHGPDVSRIVAHREVEDADVSRIMCKVENLDILVLVRFDYA